MSKNADIIVKELEKDVDILVNEASNIIDTAIRNIAWETIISYWKIGKLINEYKEEHNSKYGDNIVLSFSDELKKKYGNGFSRQQINRMCLFHKKFEIGSARSQSNNKILIGSAPGQFISWRHYMELLDIKNKDEIEYYLNEITSGKWSTRYLADQKKKNLTKGLYVIKNKTVSSQLKKY